MFDTDVNRSTPLESFQVSMFDQTDETGVQMEIEQRINRFSKYFRVVSNLPALLTVPTVRSTSTIVNLAGGDSGSAPTSANINAGWDVFKNKEKYKVDVLVNAGRTDVAVQRKMDALAQQRFDCVSFLDLPAGAQTAQSAVDFRNLDLNLNSSYSALFCSDLQEMDPISGKVLYVPPSGAMAGLLARTTRIAQPWFSMAGLNRGLLNALDVRETYDDGEATLLYQSQVNYMRKFIGQGIPLWEQQTLYAKSSALQFLNVRVLCNVIKRSVYQFLIYGLQEPGDDILSRQLKFGLEDYLRTVQNARGIKSFRVIITPTNNPPALVNSGILNIGVYIVPILAVHEIQLTLMIGKDSLEISETELAALA
jgi:phage tail sheath protein FI